MVNGTKNTRAYVTANAPSNEKKAFECIHSLMIDKGIVGGVIRMQANRGIIIGKVHTATTATI